MIKALAATEVSRSKTVTGAGLVLGTPEYMAPELIMGGKVDGGADQYALAVTVYEMLCGRRPFVGSSPTAVLVLHTTQPPAPMNEVRPDLPERLSQAVLKGLAKDSTQRYPTCAAFAGAVAAALEPSPAATAGVSAPGPASPESVKIQCPSCGKKIAIGRHHLSHTETHGKGLFPSRLSGANRGRLAEDAGAECTARDSGFSPAGTQKLATMGSEGTSGQGPASGPPRTTEKIQVPILVLGQETEPASKDRVKTQIIGRAQTQILPQSQDLEQNVARPSLLPWIGMGVTTALLLIAALAFLILPRDSREATLVRHGEHSIRSRSPGSRDPHTDAQTHRGRHADSLAPATTRAPGPQLSPTVPNVNPIPPADFAPANVASASSPPTPTPTSAPPPALATDAAAENTAAVPGSVPPVSRDVHKTEVAINVTDSPRAGAKKTSAKQASTPPLEEILAAPEQYSDQEIAPKGLFRVGKFVNYAPDGTTIIAVNQSGLSVKLTSPYTPAVVPIEGGKTVTMEVERNLAARFIAHDISTRGSVSDLTLGNWHSKLAILTLRVFAPRGRAGSAASSRPSSSSTSISFASARTCSNTRS